MNRISRVLEFQRAKQFCQCTEYNLQYQIVCRKCGLPKEFCPNWKCKRPLGECGCMSKI